MLEAAKHEALEAVDHYNRPLRDRGSEGFFVHMHLAWLYLLHPQFERDGVDYYYYDKEGYREYADNEAKTCDLAKSVSEHFGPNEPVAKNLELTIALRNQIDTGLPRYWLPLLPSTPTRSLSTSTKS
jgi:hypothetical protein